MIVLQAKTEILIDEPEELGQYFTHHSVTITTPDDGEIETALVEPTHIGTAVCSRLHIWNVGNNECVSLFDVCDSVDHHWYQLYEAFLHVEDDEIGFYRDLPELEDCCTGDLLLIDEIKIRPEYQGRGIELAVVDRLADTLGSQCELTAFYLGNMQADFEWLKQIGFKQLDGYEGFAFRNEARMHPTVHEIPGGDFRFEVHPVVTKKHEESL